VDERLWESKGPSLLLAQLILGTLVDEPAVYNRPKNRMMISEVSHWEHLKEKLANMSIRHPDLIEINLNKTYFCKKVRERKPRIRPRR
jgi:hypothetical protein